MGNATILKKGGTWRWRWGGPSGAVLGTPVIPDARRTPETGPA